MVSGCSELYIAVTLESLGIANEEGQNHPLPMNEGNFMIFYEVFSKFDADAPQFTVL